MIAFLYYAVLIVPTIAENVSVSLTTRPLSEHPLHKGWLCGTLFGVVGVVLNSLALFIFIKERSSIVTSVNTMKDENLLSMFGIGRDMVSEST